MKLERARQCAAADLIQRVEKQEVGLAEIPVELGRQVVAVTGKPAGIFPEKSASNPKKY